MKLDIVTSSDNTHWLIIAMICLSCLALIVLFNYMRQEKKKGLTNSSAPNVAVKPLKQGNESGLYNIKMVDAEKKRMGDAFEGFIIESFKPDYYTIEHRKGDKSSNGRYTNASNDPDLVMRLKFAEVNTLIAVECKYRDTINKDIEIELCELRQLENYKNFGDFNHMDVFLAIGVGGVPTKPKELYILPIGKLHTNTLRFDELKKYSKTPGGYFFYNLEEHSLT